MKIFRAIVIVALPFLLVINLYRAFALGEEGITGFKAFAEYFSTYNGLQHCIDTFNFIGTTIQDFVKAYMDTNVVNYVANLFKMLGAVLYVPIALVIDIFSTFGWLLGFREVA